MDDRRRLKELGISTSTSREQIADVYSKAIAAGEVLYPCIRGDGSSSSTVQMSMTIVIKTPIV